MSGPWLCCISSSVVWPYKYWRKAPLKACSGINTHHRIVGAALLKMNSKTRPRHVISSLTQQSLQAWQCNILKMSWHHFRQVMHLGDTWQLRLLTSSKTPQPRGLSHAPNNEKQHKKAPRGRTKQSWRNDCFFFVVGEAKFGCEGWVQ